MKKVDNRKIQVLKYIVEQYLNTGEVLGSKSLLEQYDLWVSSATIRNDMAALEKMGLIFQPYNSAGRLPTDRGIRVFVDYLMEDLPLVFLEENSENNFTKREGLIDDILYSIVERITNITHEVTFACIPSEGALCYLGITHLLENAQQWQWSDVYHIVKFLESKKIFMHILDQLQISPKVSVYIGDEHIGWNLKNSTIIAKKITLNWHIGYIWIIGSIKMDYAFNIAALRQVL